MVDCEQSLSHQSDMALVVHSLIQDYYDELSRLNLVDYVSSMKAEICLWFFAVSLEPSEGLVSRSSTDFFIEWMNFEFQKYSGKKGRGKSIRQGKEFLFQGFPPTWIICYAQDRKEVEGDMREGVRVILEKLPGTLVCRPLHGTMHVAISLETRRLRLNTRRDKEEKVNVWSHGLLRGYVLVGSWPTW